MNLALLVLALTPVAIPGRAAEEGSGEARARLDVLREGSKSGDPVRVEVARAALAAGLLTEFVSELDAVLARDPDDKAARELVARAPLALTLPAEADRSTERRLVLFGVRAKPTYRELAAVRLAASPREAVTAELGRSLVSPSASVRAFATFALRRIDPLLQADLLVRRAVVDPNATARVEAARTLRDARDESFALRVAAALDLADARLRVAAADSLGEIGHAVVLPVLAARLAAVQSGGHPGGTRAHISITNQVAYVKDFDVEIAQASSIGDPIVDVVSDGTVLDVRVGGTSIVSAADERRALCRSMRRISGVDLPDDAKKWLAWWKERTATPATR